MKTRYLFPLLTVLLIAAPAQAQVDYDMVADLTDLMDNGAQADIEISCMAAFAPPGFSGVSHPMFVFYNIATGDLVVYEPYEPVGNRTTVLVDNANLDALFGGNVDVCRTITISPFGDIYAALAVDGTTDYVYHFPLFTAAAGIPGTILAEADGITGIAVNDNPNAHGGSDIFLAMVEFFGAAEDGFYVLSPVPPDAAGGFPLEPEPLCTDAGLDLYDLAHFNGSLISNSSEFGDSSNGLQNVTVAVDFQGANGGGCFDVIYDPFDTTFGIFTNGSDGGLEDVEFLFGVDDDLVMGENPLRGGTIYGHMFNNSFGATDGEQWGATNNGLTGVRFAEQTPMLADPDITISGYDAPHGTHMVSMFDGTVYVASTDVFGGGDAIIAMYNAPIPVELTSFDAVVDGQNVTLNWETGSETNNAGFEVQMLAGESWDVLGFVNGHGTTTETQAYSHTASLQPGTYTFRLKQIDFDGQFEFLGNVEATVGTPGTHLLSNVYPNPFNPQATFDLSVATAQDVTIDLYNVLGQRVATIFDGAMEANANQSFTIDGAGLATGAYIVRINGERFSATRQITLMK